MTARVSGGGDKTHQPADDVDFTLCLKRQRGDFTTWWQGGWDDIIVAPQLQSNTGNNQYPTGEIIMTMEICKSNRESFTTYTAPAQK